MIANKYGYFDEDTGEYVIFRPDTPTPWINYLGRGSYGGIISNTAGGYSFNHDLKNRRVTRYRYNAVSMDRSGRYVYLRDQENGAYWSYVAATQRILGIRSTYEGLKIAPVIPLGWSGFKARRVFRGVTYHISVAREGKGNTLTLTVDGRTIMGDIVPFPDKGTEEVQVSVVVR